MKWSTITDRSAALRAIEEFDRLGRESFLTKYGFGPSTHLFVRHEGRLYDIKALAGATRGYAEPGRGPLKNNEFSSGRPIMDLFRRLGFEVVDQSQSATIEQAHALREALQALLSGYLAQKTSTISKASPMWEAIVRAEDALRELTKEYPHIEVRSSVGKGNWAEVPWISLLDDRVTDTTKHGVYVVYLFRADMTGVYATFNQGVTDLKGELGWPAAYKTLVGNAAALRERYSARLRPTFTSADGIELRPKKGGLGAEYEASTISWRLYESGALPPAEELLDDLYRLLDVYDDYATEPKGATMAVDASTVRPIPLTASVTAGIRAQGYTFEPWQVATFVHALRTKPFLILAGISGTGKSKLPKLVGALTGTEVNLIAVRPDWTDSSDLLGYTDLRGNFVPGQLLLLAKKATEDPSRQYVAVLDEMNLARVEQYFAEVLSLLEDRSHGADGFASKTCLVPSAPEPWRAITLPTNLAIVGTVNMDETTHGFSKKVLDRAFTLEMSEVDLTSWRPLGGTTGAAVEAWRPEYWRARALRPGDLVEPSDAERRSVEDVVQVLGEANQILAIAQLQVGYRVRDEIAMFLLHAAEDPAAFSAVKPLDLALHMKVLPRIQGGSSAIRAVVRQLISWAHDGSRDQADTRSGAMIEAWQVERLSAIASARFPRTAARLCLMWERLQADGFTSYWL